MTTLRRDCTHNNALVRALLTRKNRHGLAGVRHQARRLVECLVQIKLESVILVRSGTDVQLSIIINNYWMLCGHTVKSSAGTLRWRDRTGSEIWTGYSIITPDIVLPETWTLSRLGSRSGRGASCSHSTRTHPPGCSTPGTTSSWRRSSPWITGYSIVNRPDIVLSPPGLCVIDDVIVEQGAGVEHLADDGDLFLQIRDPGRERGLQAENRLNWFCTPVQ